MSIYKDFTVCQRNWIKKISLWTTNMFLVWVRSKGRMENDGHDKSSERHKPPRTFEASLQGVSGVGFKNWVGFWNLSVWSLIGWYYIEFRISSHGSASCFQGLVNQSMSKAQSAALLCSFQELHQEEKNPLTFAFCRILMAIPSNLGYTRYEKNHVPRKPWSCTGKWTSCIPFCFDE